MSARELSPEQRAVVDSWGCGMAVLAGAGSGKTTTLVAKCLELLRRRSDARFAAVSFTERSASDLRAKLSESLPDPERDGGALGPHWVMTIHGLCGAILREYPREAGYDGEEEMLSEAEAGLLWDRAVESLWFDELSPQTHGALDQLLARESMDGLKLLLKRVRELSGFGVLERLSSEYQNDADALPKGGPDALYELGSFVTARYERLKRRRGALDFNDLERGADRALAHARVREAFQSRFDLVLVDEFQDTNPVQAGVIRRFCRPDASNLCVVGDPKQSIYRFRDADVSVFEDFCSRLPERHSLTWNFRSRPGVLAYANALCAPLFEACPPGQEDSHRMAYEALVPKREPSGEPPVVRVDLASPRDLASFIHAETRRGIRLDQMALLLRRIRGNESWLKALTSAGIRIAVGSGGLFWEDPRVRELTALLKWWDHPGNSLSAAVFLRAPWVGVPDELIDRWVRQDPTLTEPFFGSAHPLARSLAPLRSRVVRPGEVLLALLESEESAALEAELGSSLLGLWHRVEDLSCAGHEFHAVVGELARALEESRRERDVPPPRNQGQLPVLTLHSSKGLEFEHVILVDLGKKPRAPSSPLLYWDRQKGAYLAPRDADGGRPRNHPVEEQWREREKAKNLAESKRLFYVALTRARERLILACPELPIPARPSGPSPTARGGAAGDGKSATACFLTDDWRAWVDAGPEPDARVSLASGQPEARRAEEDQGAREAAPGAGPAVVRSRPAARFFRPRHSVTEWNLLSRCPRSYEWTYIRPRVVAEGISEIGLFTGEKVATAVELEISRKELGTRVHSCLERGDYDGLKALESEVGAGRFSAEPVISWALSSEWMAPARPSENREVWTELEFEIPVGSEVLVGSMDRVIRDSRKGYSIIDFKVTEKPKSIEALLEAYQTQLELYAWALARLEAGATSSAAAARCVPVEALIVNISPRTIQAVPVRLGGGGDGPGSGGAQCGFAGSAAAMSVEGLAAEASRIVSGSEGRAIPGPLCRFCSFRPICAEGRAIEFPSNH